MSAEWGGEGREADGVGPVTYNRRSGTVQGAFPNMRCNPERFFELLLNLGVKQREWVAEMGFGELLKISVRRVDRYLCLWLMRRINVGNPVNWSTRGSRIDAWEQEIVKDVIEKDRFSLVEFGRAEIVTDLVYGAPYPIGNAVFRWEEVRHKGKRAYEYAFGG